MTPTLRLAVIALDEAQPILEALEDTPETIDLLGRLRTLRRVLHGIVIERIPENVTDAQEAALLGRVLKLTQDVTDLADELAPMEHSGPRRAWSPIVERLRSGAA